VVLGNERKLKGKKGAMKGDYKEVHSPGVGLELKDLRPAIGLKK